MKMIKLINKHISRLKTAAFFVGLIVACGCCPPIVKAQSLTPLQQANYTPVWQEDFGEMLLTKMQWAYAYGPGAAINNYLISNAVHLGQFKTSSATEHQLNHYRMTPDEPRTQTVEFDLYATFPSSNPASARIFVRPHWNEYGVFIYLQDTRVDFQNIGGSSHVVVRLPDDDKVGGNTWAHVVVSMLDLGSTLETVVAINDVVLFKTMNSRANLDDLWNKENGVWSLEYNQGDKESGFYIKNVRGYREFINENTMKSLLTKTKVDAHLAGLGVPSTNNGTKLLMKSDLAGEIKIKVPLAIAYAHRQEGRRVTFDGGCSQSWYPLKSYEWDYGDGTSGSGKLVNHTYQANGTYNVTLTVKASSGSPSTDSEMISVTVSGTGDPTPTDVLGDVSGDGLVNATDFRMVLSAWGQTSTGNPANLMPLLFPDTRINVLDLGLIIKNWNN